jgi:hypothetical protein
MTSRGLDLPLRYAAAELGGAVQGINIIAVYGIERMATSESLNFSEFLFGAPIHGEMEQQQGSRMSPL